MVLGVLSSVGDWRREEAYSLPQSIQASMTYDRDWHNKIIFHLLVSWKEWI